MVGDGRCRTGGLWATPTFSSLIWILIFLFTLLPLANAAPECLRFADAHTINQAFVDGGPGKKVFLCPSKTYRLRGTIIFTSADQELATLNYPTGPERATLIVAGDFATAVQGDCRRCARVKVSSLIINGNRKELGRIPDVNAATGLVVIGGNEGQTIRDSWLRDPRGFTAIHVREGDNLQCKKALIEKNEIGPVGEEFDPQVDGPDPETSPDGRPLADGVSIACRDSTIRDNDFYDNTDAAIVIYGSPGTVVHANHISTKTKSAMAGILMVDSTPFNGDYTGTTVRSNVIDAARKMIRVGIGIGAAVWSDDTETVLSGGRVTANGIRGKFMGFGIAATGLKDWIIKGNWDEAQHQGVRSDRCFDEPINPDPMSFLMDARNIKESDLQKEFADHEFEYVVCIDQDEGFAAVDEPKITPPIEAGEVADRPAKKVTPPPPPVQVMADAGKYETGSDVMDEILEHSQQRMLEAIEKLGWRVDTLASAANVDKPSLGGRKQDEHTLTPLLAESLADLQSRIEKLETKQHHLLETATTMRKTIKAWDQQLATMNEWQYDVLLDVAHRLNLFVSTQSLEHDHRLHGDHPLSSLSNRARFLSSVNMTSLQEARYGSAVTPIAILGAVVIIYLGYTRYSRRFRHSKRQ